MSVAQRKALVTGDAEGRQQVEAFVQERLEARGRRIGWMEQVINLLAGRTQSRHWRAEANTLRNLDQSTNRENQTIQDRIILDTSPDVNSTAAGQKSLSKGNTVQSDSCLCDFNHVCFFSQPNFFCL